MGAEDDRVVSYPWDAAGCGVRRSWRATACPSPCDRLARRAKFCFLETPNQWLISGHPDPARGADRASSRTRDGMWWTRERRQGPSKTRALRAARPRRHVLDEAQRRVRERAAGGWLPFLDTYRTMCRAPEPAFRRILEDMRELRFAAKNGRLIWGGRQSSGAFPLRPCESDVDLFGDGKGVINLNAKIPHGALDLGVAEQQLHGTEVAGSAVDQCRLGSSQ